MRKYLVCSVACVVATMIVGTAHSSDWNANVAVASDYIVRGLTRSLNSAEVQGSIGIQGERHWAAGVWASSVELYENAGRYVELDYYVSGELALSRDWRMGAQVIRYEFTGESASYSYDYTDLAVSLSFQDTITASATWSPDYTYYTRFGPVSDVRMLSYDLSARHPVNRYVQLTAGVGCADFGSRGGAYNFWSAGAETSWERVSLGVSYVSSDSAARRLFGEVAAHDAWVATISFRVH